jgi:phage-related protein
MTNLSLYNVNAYAGATSYSKNDIVLYNNIYYYSLVNNNIGNTPTSSPNSYWGGHKIYTSLAKPDFIWTPSYASQLQLKPAVNVVRFGNGYEQRVPDGINSNQLRFNLNFEGRDSNEARAIAHFLHKRKGSEGFFFNAPFPYNFDGSQLYPKRFVCEEWDINYNFYDNYNLNVRLTETANL